MAVKRLFTSWRGILLILGLLALIALALVPSPSTSTGALLVEVVDRCPEPQVGLRGRGEFLVIGHRGAAGYAVENTLPSMDTAVARGANALEIDLCMTADSAIVLWHDWNPDDFIAETRETDGEPDVLCAPHFPDEDSPYYRPVHRISVQELRTHYGYRLQDSTEARVQAHIPTLEEFLQWADSQPMLRAVFLDIKIPEADSAIAPAMMERIRELLAAHAPRYKTVFLTPHPPVFRMLDALLPEGNLSFDIEPPSGLVLEPCDFSSARIALNNGNHYASAVMPFTSTFAPWTTMRRIIQCDLEMRKQSNQGQSGIEYVIASTIDDESKIECLVALGIDGIITDYPDLVRKVADGIAQAR
jgi:glycerophosphoryl diester phosphodiesterase